MENTLLKEYQKARTEGEKICAISVILNELKYNWPVFQRKGSLFSRNKSKADHLLTSLVHFYASGFEKSFEEAKLAADVFTLELPKEYFDFLISQMLLTEDYSTVLVELTSKLLERLFQQKEFESLLCLALETKQLSFIVKTLEAHTEHWSLFTHTLLALLNNDAGRLLADCEKKLLYEVILNNHTEQGLTDVRFHVLRKLGNWAVLADELWQHLLSSATLPSALERCFELADQEPAKVLNTLVALLHTSFVKTPHKTANKLLLVVRVLSGHYSEALSLASVQSCALAEENVVSAMRQNHSFSSLHDLFALVAHSLLEAASGDLSFVNRRESWLTKQALWNQFVAVAVLGTVFRESSFSARNVLRAFSAQLEETTSLSTNQSVILDGRFKSSVGKVYSVGGAAQALGLAVSGKAWTPDSFLVLEVLERLLYSPNGVSQYGASVGLGLVLFQNGYCAQTLSSSVVVDQFRREKARVVAKLRAKVEEDHFEVSAGAAIGFALSVVGDFECSLENGTASSGWQETTAFLLARLRKTEHVLVRRALAIAFGVLHFGLLQKFPATYRDRLAGLRLLLEDSEPFVRLAVFVSLGLGFVSCPPAVFPEVAEAFKDSLAVEHEQEVLFVAHLALGFVASGHPEFLSVFRSAEAIDKHPSVRVRSGAVLASALACLGETAADSPLFDETYSAVAALCACENKVVRSHALLALGLLASSSPEVALPTQLVDNVLESKSRGNVVFGAALGLGFARAGRQTRVVKTAAGERVRSGALAVWRKDLGTCLGLLFACFFSKWFPFAALSGLALHSDVAAVVSAEELPDGSLRLRAEKTAVDTVCAAALTDTQIHAAKKRNKDRQQQQQQQTGKETERTEVPKTCTDRLRRPTKTEPFGGLIKTKRNGEKRVSVVGREEKQQCEGICYLEDFLN